MTYRKVYFVLLAALLVIASVAILSACGTATDPAGDSRDTTAASPSPAATGEPLMLGFDAGFTGFMAMDVELAEKGILTRLDMIQNQWEGRPVEYNKADNGSDPVQAVDKARQLVESDRSSSWPARSSRRPPPPSPTTWPRPAASRSAPSSVSPATTSRPPTTWPSCPTASTAPRATTSASTWARSSATRPSTASTTRTPPRVSCRPVSRRASRESGGKVLSTQYVPIDTIDFSSYLTTLKDADATYFWVFGNGAAPFVKQYNDYGLTAPLIAPMSNNFSRAAARRPRRSSASAWSPATSTARRSTTSSTRRSSTRTRS